MNQLPLARWLAISWSMFLSLSIRLQERVKIFFYQVVTIPGGKKMAFKFRQSLLGIRQKLGRVLRLAIQPVGQVIGHRHGSSADVHN